MDFLDSRLGQCRLEQVVGKNVPGEDLRVDGPARVHRRSVSEEIHEATEERKT